MASQREFLKVFPNHVTCLFRSVKFTCFFYTKMAVCARLYRTVIIEHVKRTKFHLNQHILKGSRCTFHTSSLHPKSAETDLCKQLKAKIRLTGPITVAEYMKEVLTNPIAVSI
ncbi:hypothetical protein LSH36_725g01053 [Paralvinella palmiformis]|uniref:Uncharacterized protein n=1 Tax=Paralvinella palmiformis TaxID=53620 RepID=A0AAD9J2E2_9ANNE|nr:hypothetical protein LSH36_725g01053 [Paralvinella palmiformis]